MNDIFNGGKKSSRNKITTVIIAVIVLLSLLITNAPSFNLPFDLPTWNELFESTGLSEQSKAAKQPFSAHFIDVGQGDCAIIKTENSAILIDSGERGNADKILNYLRNIGVSSIDYIIATHPHSDHIGSMADIIDAVDVHHIIMPRIPQENIPTTKTYENFLLSAQKSKAKVISAKANSEYFIDGITMTILAPISQDSNLNNMSVVARIEYGKTSFIFTGDIEAQVEKQLLKEYNVLNADVLKVAHHGSATSSTKGFIKAVNPEIAVISCAVDNPYGHPHKDVLSLFTDMNIDSFRTDLCGDIIIGSDGNDLYITTEKWMEEF